MYFSKNPKTLQYFCFTDNIEDCDVAIVPISNELYFKNGLVKKLDLFIENAKKAKKSIWACSSGDNGLSYRNSEVTIFRTSGFDSKLSNNTVLMPCFIDDPIEHFRNQEIYFINKSTNIKIGFVGNASGSWLKFSRELFSYVVYNFKILAKKEFVDFQHFYPASIKRFWFLRKMARNQNFETDFILRNEYRGGSKTKEEVERTTHDFFQNIIHNPYTFCKRGGGNFSVRFYETVAMGRIPVFLSTDSRLPMQELINWEEHCLISSADNFIENIIKLHQKISDAEFLEMQQKNRILYQEKLNRVNFFIEIAKNHDNFTK